MKKILYILVLLAGMGLSQCVSACFACCYNTQTRNNVVRTVKGENVTYKYTYPNGLTMRASYCNGICYAWWYTWYLFPCTCQYAETDEDACLKFMMLEAKFDK